MLGLEKFFKGAKDVAKAGAVIAAVSGPAQAVPVPNKPAIEQSVVKVTNSLSNEEISWLRLVFEEILDPNKPANLYPKLFDFLKDFNKTEYRKEVGAETKEGGFERYQHKDEQKNSFVFIEYKNGELFQFRLEKIIGGIKYVFEKGEVSKDATEDDKKISPANFYVLNNQVLGTENMDHEFEDVLLAFEVVFATGEITRVEVNKYKTIAKVFGIDLDKANITSELPNGTVEIANNQETSEAFQKMLGAFLIEFK